MMTVQELKKLLEKLPDDMHVVERDYDDSFLVFGKPKKQFKVQGGCFVITSSHIFENGY